ncbi:MAG: hydroxypyruvate isomerase [Candidatus Eremiobacteraeota bacterium]|jgi:hydroxypyruvate isomerase|nr:hydroxypyruvate isomerase [Candidatus Eremiobacteraeota bacterium]
MPRFCANLSFLFQDLPFYDRIDAAAANGFAGVEYMSPYEYEVAEIKRRLRAHGLTQVLFNLPVGDFAKGERGYASDPARVEEFREGVAEAVDIARELDCKRVNCLVGIAIPGNDGAYARATLVKNVRYAAKALDAIGATLVIEPLNRIETPGFLIGTSAEALSLIADTGASNAKLQYDVYHAQRAEGNIIATIRAHAAKIGHVQIADSPGRNEPGTGELAYERIIPVFDEVGYDGWIGLEYRPSRPVPDAFSWVGAYRAREVAAL